MLSGGLGSLASSLLSLIFIILLAIVSIRLLGRHSGMGARHRLVQIVAVLPMGANKTMQVIVLGDKRILVVGVGNQMESLASFEDEELASELLNSYMAQNQFPGSSLWSRIRFLGLSISTLKRKRNSSRDQTFESTTDNWDSVQQRLEVLRSRRQDVIRDVEENRADYQQDTSFQEILTDLARRQK